MVLESSATIMDTIFASLEEESRVRLMKIIQDFLIAEASKHSAMAKGKCDSFTLHNLWTTACRIKQMEDESFERQHG
jgi:hypothetical protein